MCFATTRTSTDGSSRSLPFTSREWLSFKRSWYESESVPGRDFKAIVFVDRDWRSDDSATLRQHYHRLIESSRLLAGTDSVRLDDGVFCCDATSAAIQSALAGSVAVHTMLSNSNSADVAECFYSWHVKDAASRHAAWAAQHYAENWHYAAETFWQRRANKAQAAVAAVRNDAIRQNWRKDDCVARSPDIKIEDVPSVVGDFVVLRPAVSHPTLLRPVAFVGELDLSAFLDRMPPVSRISDLEHALSSVLPRDGVPAVLDWLLDLGLPERSHARSEII